MHSESLPASAAPVRFAPPPGWPVPDGEWQRVYAGWAPPAGWTPRDELSPAPARWRYWRPSEGWSDYSRELMRPGQRTIVVALSVMIGGLALRLLGSDLLDDALLGIVAVGIGLLGVAGLVVGALLTVRTRRFLMEHLRIGAEARIEAFHRERYAQYLLDRSRA